MQKRKNNNIFLKNQNKGFNERQVSPMSKRRKKSNENISLREKNNINIWVRGVSGK